MAADPGSSGVSGGPYHLFLTRIPPKLPKEEVEAALSAELASRNVKVRAISVVPQSAWKNKGFGFVVLDGSPSASEVGAVAARLDNCVRVGGKAVNVRVCQASVSGGKPAVTPGTLTSWDQPAEKITRLCAQVLHCYFARRTHQEAYKAEKLFALLSMSIAPSCCQEPKPVSLWGRDVYGSLEKTLLAIGDSHFGGGWSLSGTIADRDAMLSIGKARHMQGWNSLRDPLPIATLLRLAACKQRLEGIHTPDVGSGLSTPTVCRRCSDCGSLSAMHSTEQPSCSQSEASWSLGSLYTAPATAGDHTGSERSPSSLCTPVNDTDGTALSTKSTTPGSSGSAPSSSGSCESWGSCKSLEPCSGRGGGTEGATPGDRGQRTADAGGSAGSAPLLPAAAAPAPAVAAVAAVAVTPQPAPAPGDRTAAGHPIGGTDASSSTACASTSTSGSSPSAAVSGSAAAAAARAAVASCRAATASALANAPRPQHRAPRSLQHSHSSSSSSSCLSPGLQPGAQQRQPQQHAAHWPAAQAGSSQLVAAGASALQPPSARDLLGRCARRLRSLFRRQPAQISYAVADVASYLSEAQEVVAWGRDAPYFSLEGYACAVYGSFERFLLEISRLHFNDSWCFAGGHGPGEPRVMFRTRRLTAAGAFLS